MTVSIEPGRAFYQVLRGEVTANFIRRIEDGMALVVSGESDNPDIPEGSEASYAVDSLQANGITFSSRVEAEEMIQQQEHAQKLAEAQRLAAEEKAIEDLQRMVELPGIAGDAGRLVLEINAALVEAVSIPSRGVGPPPGHIYIHPVTVKLALLNCFWTGSKLTMLNRRNSLVEFGKGDAVLFMERICGDIWMSRDAFSKHISNWAAANHMEGTPDYTKARAAKANYCYALPWAMVFNHLMEFQQRKLIEMRVDMFAEDGRIIMQDESARVIYPHAPFEVTGEPSEEIVADFMKHFPELDDFLEFIVASRFAADRKLAYLWMHCPSDWGKGFLLSALTDLGVVVEMSVKEIEAAFEGRPIGKSMIDFKRAFVVAVDEFKSTKSELKQLQNEIQLSPKHQLQQRVEIFAKLFLSAEGVPSMASADGVEDQFANRMNYYRGKGDLKARELFQQVGKSRYFRAVRHYVATELNALVEHYQAAESPAAAEEEADGVLLTFAREHGITKERRRLSEAIVELGEEFVGWVSGAWRLSKDPMGKPKAAEREAAGNVLVTDKGVFIGSPAKTIELWLADSRTTAERGALYFKAEDILKAVTRDNRGVTSHRVTRDRVMKAAHLDLPADKQQRMFSELPLQGGV